MFNTIRYLLLPVLNASGPVFIWLARSHSVHALRLKAGRRGGQLSDVFFSSRSPWAWS